MTTTNVGSERVVGRGEAQHVEAEHDQRCQPHPPAPADRLRAEDVAQPPDRCAERDKDGTAYEQRGRLTPEQVAGRRHHGVGLHTSDPGEEGSRADVQGVVDGRKQERAPEPAPIPEPLPRRGGLGGHDDPSAEDSTSPASTVAGSAVGDTDAADGREERQLVDDDRDAARNREGPVGDP